MSDLNIVLRIIERREEAPDCLSIRFARPPGVVYQPGDWMDIRFPTPEFPVGRTYSFASSPTEPDLCITFKRGVSPFKRRLALAEPGETMLITQYGSNVFLLDRRYPAVFIAGGVGITPFRSMLKTLVDTDAHLPVTLIYQHRTELFPFRDELDAWTRELPDLRCATWRPRRRAA
jgi:ferredoxin-NADP reductase